MSSLVVASSLRNLPGVCWLQGVGQNSDVGLRSTTWALNPLKSLWVVASLGAQPQGVLVAPRGPSSVLSATADDALQRLCDKGHLDRALDVLSSMDGQGIVPSANTYRSLLKLCAKKKALAQAEQAQVHLTKNGLEFTGFLGESVVITLVKCGAIKNALQMFHRLKQKTVFSWTAVISGSSLSGQGHEALRLYRCMQQEGVQPNTYTFVSLLKACGSIADLEEGKRIHSEAIKHNCDSDLFVRTCLVDMYGKCGSTVDARNVFDLLPERDVVAWTAMLGAYVQQGQTDKALELYEGMREESMRLDVPIFVGVLQACGMLAEKEEDDLDGISIKFKSLDKAKAIHAEAWRKGYDSDTFVGSTLISVYGKCGSITDAQNVFEGLCRKNEVSWTAMLTIYAQQGQAEETLQLYEQMLNEGLDPDTCTFVTVLLACGLLAEKEEDCLVDGKVTKVKCLEKGRAIHAAAKRRGVDSHVLVGNSLVTIYAKCGSVLDAQNVFHGLVHRDVVSWNAMLGAYSQNGQGGKVVQLYMQMLKEGVSPNEITLVCILRTWSSAGGLNACRQIYSNHISSGKDVKPVLASTLIHVFSKCASMVDAQSVFDALPQPDVVSWTALIAGYAREGDWSASLQRYEEGRVVGMKPDSVTFVSLLSACSHAGRVDKGVEYFESMVRDYGISPAIEHYVCMVDLLGRAGYFESVDHLLGTMPMLPNLALWLCLLGACRKHGKVVLGRHAFLCSLQIQPKHPAAYVLMYTIYADAGLWDCANEVTELRQNAGAWKKPGKSWIEHEHRLHTFVAGTHRHHQLYDISEKVSFELEQDGPN